MAEARFVPLGERYDPGEPPEAAARRVLPHQIEIGGPIHPPDLQHQAAVDGKLS